MAKFSFIANSFKSGRLGQQLVGRTDIREYQNGALEMRNMINNPIGGAFRRPGFAHFAENFGKALLIPFVLGLNETYLVSVNGATSNGTGLGTPSVYDEDGNQITVGRTVFDLARKWPDDPTDIRWAQFGRYLFLCDSKGVAPPAVLYQERNGNFYFKDYMGTDFPDTPGAGENIPRGFKVPYIINLNTGLQIEYARGATYDDDTITMKDSAGDPTDFFEAGAEAYFKIFHGSKETIVQQGDFVSSSVVKVNSGGSFGTRIADGHTTTDWARSAWDNQVGWPRTVTIFQQRLIFGGNQNSPNTVWASAIARPFIMMQDKLFQDETTDDSGFGYFGDADDLQAFVFPISSTQSTSVVWLGSQRTLHVGTDTVEYALISDAGNFGAISFPVLRPQTFHGGRNIQPSRIGRFSLFIGEDGRDVRDFAYSDNNGSHVSRDLSSLSPDIIYESGTPDTYNQVTYKVTAWQESNRCLWLVNNKGGLISFNYEETSDLKGWAHHEIGGDAEVLSCAVVPYKGETTLFLSVKRNINGSDVFYIERLVALSDTPKLTGTDVEINYLDGGARYAYETATDTHACDWLEGEEIYALADGVLIGPITVGASNFTTPSTVSEISFGYKYKHKLSTMPIEAGSVVGSSQGQLKRVDRIYLDLYRAKGSKLSYGDTSYPIEYPSIPANEVFTGRIQYQYDSTPSEKYFVTLEGDDPVPFGLLNMTLRGETYE